MNPIETKPAAAHETELWPDADRRRPGRPVQVSPTLLPLLRGQSVGDADVETGFGDPDQLRGARGLITGLAISALLWGGLTYLARLVLS